MELPAEVFSKNTKLQRLSLPNNQLRRLPDAGVFESLTALDHLDLRGNQLKELPAGIFSSRNARLWYLFLSHNQLAHLSAGVFENLTNLIWLYLDGNQLTELPVELFSKNTRLLRVLLSNISLQSVPQGIFQNYAELSYLNPSDSDNGVIEVRASQGIGAPVISALLASGFRQKHVIYHTATLVPCPLGTFLDSSIKGEEGCQSCPPGGFYSDTLAYVGKTCKKCPNGSFVEYGTAPGKRPQDCKSCPLGTETDFLAGRRACKCLEGQYRTNMFDRCFKCGKGGLKCQDDYASLKSGYWWEWRNVTYKDRYNIYIKNILAPSPVLDHFHVQYPYPIPTPYRCPAEESCKGGLDSRCDKGYEGPLCSVCSSGYYKHFKTCTRCPSKKGIMVQLSIILVILLIIITGLVWQGRRRMEKNDQTFLIDNVFSKVKIVIGFYQVTYGLLDVFSYIKWPGSLENIAKYSGFLQLNVLQIAPIQCLFPGLHLDAFGSLFAIMAMNVAIFCFSFIAYGVQKLLIVRNRNIEQDEKSIKFSQSKELVYRNLFFFLYVTYLSTCYKTASVLPIACTKLCRDDKEVSCSSYLKADYSVPCQGRKYNHMLVVAYISTAYILALPFSTFIALWRQRKARLVIENAYTSQDPGFTNKEIISGLRFLFENYKSSSWYWELVEMTRKVILTCGLIFVGQNSRSYIGFALVIAGMYGFVFAWVKPLQDATENRLMTTSLAVTVINLVIGSVSKIPTEYVEGGLSLETDALLFTILVSVANSMVISQLVVQYGFFLYGYIKEWRKNRQLSFSCCLALLLPLNDFQGEISGLAGTDVLTTQLDTGEFEMATIQPSIEDIGAVDVTIEENEEHDDGRGNTEEGKDEKRQGVKYTNKKKRSWDSNCVIGAFHNL